MYPPLAPEEKSDLAISKSAKVKNKNPAPVQITAEQLLREANERRELPRTKQKQKILDQAELDEFRHRKRKGFEDAIRMNNRNFGVWLKYAQFEESQQEFERARSVFERALAEDYQNEKLWMKYAEMEMKNKFINHARNVYDRAVNLLPRVDQFWYKYAYMEEMLENVAGARQIYERWMQWEPSEDAFLLYIKFEKRYEENDRVRDIFRRLVTVHPESKNWIKWAKFEDDNLEYENARQVYQGAIDALGELSDQTLFISFAWFEARLKEYDRARAIFQYGFKVLPNNNGLLQKEFTKFERQWGKRSDIEDAVIEKRRSQYEQKLMKDSRDYDIWFDLIRLEENLVESGFPPGRCREVYERAVSNIPQIAQKKHWRRYIYLWIYYAIFEETVTQDIDNTRKVYQKCVEAIPHKKFTFAKIWLLFAKFEIRQLQLTAARKILGRAIGIAPKPKLFKGYIELELQLRELDRCRKLYEKMLQYQPTSVYAWCKYAELESLLEEEERARGIFELAVQQPLDMPEMVWKAYIDFEIELGEHDYVRKLYQRLLENTDHPKVWISWAQFEFSLSEDVYESFRRARDVFQKGYDKQKDLGKKEERRFLLLAWLEFEREHKSDNSKVKDIIPDLEKKVPQQVKKRRRIGEADQAEEYFDLVFPDDEEENSKGIAKFLSMARKFKEAQKSAE